jgi:hypothetical protein
MLREIKVGSISWINESPNPVWFSGDAAMLDPAWVPKTYMGLAATANHMAPDTNSDFRAYQKNKDFRALMYCHLQVTIDDSTKRIRDFKVPDAMHDPGWTPPFHVRHYPMSGLRFWDKDIWWDWTAHQGEASPISMVGTEGRHRNSAITTIPGSEKVLVDGNIKFRVGANTDRVGVEKVGCPFHVPWVWCEMVLTYVDDHFKLYGRGSIFPTHCWYVDGAKVATQDQVSDSSFPKASVTYPVEWAPYPVPRINIQIPEPLTIEVRALRLYPVLSKGAPAAGPQASLSAVAAQTGAVDTHTFTVNGGAVATSP